MTNVQFAINELRNCGSDSYACDVEELRDVVISALRVANKAPELNMGNYDEDQVHELNNAMIEIFGLLNEAVGECL